MGAQEAVRRGCDPGGYASRKGWERPTIMLMAAGNRCKSQVAGSSRKSQ